MPADSSSSINLLLPFNARLKEALVRPERPPEVVVAIVNIVAGAGAVELAAAVAAVVAVAARDTRRTKLQTSRLLE